MQPTLEYESSTLKPADAWWAERCTLMIWAICLSVRMIIDWQFTRFGAFSTPRGSPETLLGIDREAVRASIGLTGTALVLFGAILRRSKFSNRMIAAGSIFTIAAIFLPVFILPPDFAKRHFYYKFLGSAGEIQYAAIAVYGLMLLVDRAGRRGISFALQSALLFWLLGVSIEYVSRWRIKWSNLMLFWPKLHLEHNLPPILWLLAGWSLIILMLIGAFALRWRRALPLLAICASLFLIAEAYQFTYTRFLSHAYTRTIEDRLNDLAWRVSSSSVLILVVLTWCCRQRWQRSNGFEQTRELDL